VKGRIWRVTYHGPAGLKTLTAAPTAKVSGEAASAAALPVPPGATAEQVAAGDTLYHGQTCVGCHGADAKGTPVGPDLTSGKWLWGDGSLASIRKVIQDGVSMPKQYRQAMPAMGGAQLSTAQLQDVSAYVWAVGHPKK